VSGNLLRLCILQQLLHEIYPADGFENAPGPLELFDLIVARDTPFIRRVIQEWSRPGVSQKWLDFVYSHGMNDFESFEDAQFGGYGPIPSGLQLFHSSTRLSSTGSAKVILHNPSRGMIQRSYIIEDQARPVPQLDPPARPITVEIVCDSSVPRATWTTIQRPSATNFVSSGHARQR